MKFQRRSRQQLLQYLPLALLIGIALGFFALWQQERMLRSWAPAEGLVIHLELPEQADATPSVETVTVVFNYTAEDDRVYQGAVRAGKLTPASSGLRSYLQQDAGEVLAPLTAVLDFFVAAEVGAVYHYDAEQEVTLRSFEDTRRLRIPFEHAPRLQLRYHPDMPERYRLEDVFTPSSTLYRNGFFAALLTVLLLGLLMHRRDVMARQSRPPQAGQAAPSRAR